MKRISDIDLDALTPEEQYRFHKETLKLLEEFSDAFPNLGDLIAKYRENLALMKAFFEPEAEGEADSIYEM